MNKLNYNDKLFARQTEPLANKKFEILTELIQHQQNTFIQDELFKHIWCHNAMMTSLKWLKNGGKIG